MSNQINTRWAEIADKQAIAKLLRGLMVYTAALYEKPESDIKSLEEVQAGVDKTFAGSSNIRYVAAECDGEIAGICAVETSYSTWHAKPYIVLNDLFVDPKFRNSGIARELLQFVTDHAYAIGCCRLDLFVEDQNKPAQKLYESFGFDKLKQASYSLPIEPSDGLP